LRIAAVSACLLLAACASFETAGEPADHFVTPAIAAAYLPLHAPAYLVLERRGAAVVIAPGVAVTNAHNAGMVDEAAVIGRSPGYDLLFFRASGRMPPPFAAPKAGEEVVAYGQGGDNDLRVAQGVVRGLDVPIPRDCPGCAPQMAFAFEADAGHGFSGGPVVDAKTGALLGIVFGFRKSDEARKERIIYAYDMAHVMAELAKLTNASSGR
jgi:S1-C subfamily serine protease